jgi:putative ABC transport system permease protein
MSLSNDNFRLAYRSLKASKARSFLTMFGIVIGVMAVILVVCIGQGIKEQIAGQLGSYGKDVLTVTPGTSTPGLGTIGGISGASSTLLTGNDLRTVDKTTGVAEAVPLATASGSVTGDHAVQSPFIVATNSNFPDIVNQSFSSGGFFGPDDDKTVVLGAAIAQKLFNNDQPLGQGLVWRGQRYVVAGVYNFFKAPPFSIEANFDNAVFVPYSTAQQVTNNGLGIYEILARADNASTTPQAVAAVRSALIAAHSGANDVTVTRATDSGSASNQTIHLLTVLVSGAAVIALIVAGVGIMDVMLVSVTERMHEIGLRKAIGATNRQIMRQFIAEAFVLSGLGALVGVAFAAGFVGILRAYTSVQAVLVWQVMVVAPVIAIAIGVFFGSMPALKAARKDPIEALRHE